MKYGVLLLVSMSMMAFALCCLAEAGDQNSSNNVSVALSDNQQPDSDKSGDKSLKAINWFPVIFYTQENGLALGLGTMRAFEKDRENKSNRFSSVTAMSFYTLKEQFLINISPDLYFKQNEYNIKMQINYSNMPSQFYGHGDEFSKEDEGEEFESENIFFQGDFKKRIYSNIHLGLRYEWHDFDVSEKEVGGLLDQKIFVGSDGGTISGAGIIINHDSRNHTFWPTSGGYQQFTAMKYSDKIKSDFNFMQYILDARYFYPIGQKSVMAIQGVAQYSDGDVPFNRLAQLGGSQIIRGIYQGRYRDNHLLAIQGEYRFPLKGRWFATVFAALGQVAHDVSDFGFDELKYTAGGGFRFALDPKHKMNLRMDIGISEFGITPIIILSEAF